MTDVSCRIVLDQLDFMEKRGEPKAAFFEFIRKDIGEVPDADPAFIANAENWVSWRTFASMCRYWNPRFSDALIDEFLECTVTQPLRWIAIVTPLIKLLTGPRQLYWLLSAWASRANFPRIGSTYEDLGDGRIKLTVTFPPGYERVLLFERITPRMVAMLPRLIGHEMAVVETTTFPDRVEYTVIPPTSASVLSTVVRHVKAVFAIRTLTSELAMRDAALRESYASLLQMRTELETKVEERTKALAQANRELSKRVEALKIAEELAHIGRWEWDFATNDLRWSDETYRIFGIDPKDRPVSIDRIKETVRPEDIPLIRDARLRAMQDGVPMYCEHGVVFPDGEVRYVLERGKVEWDETGTPVRMVGTIHDITIQKRYEATLIAAKDNADAANRMKSAFLANMSHEIRTPMSSVLGFAELLTAPALDEGRRQAFAEKILRNGRHLLALIDDALDLAKIEAGRLKVEPAKCSPAAEVNQALDILRDQAEAKGLHFTLKVVEPFPKEMRTDPIRFRQILLNIIGNAVKFTSRGGVTISARHIGAVLEISVEDTGLGIDEGARDLLFQPFSQVPNAPHHTGSGLGLALARRLARALGGDVVLAASAPGHGSRFVITVLAEMSTERIEAPVQSINRETVPLIAPGTDILVVEDTQDLQELLKRTLERAGATVTVAEDGEACLQAAARHPYKLILLDMHMPKVSGYEAARRLRLTGFRHPIIALTAYAMPSEREKCFAAGCNDFLAKPVETRLLLKTVTRWIQAGAAP